MPAPISRRPIRGRCRPPAARAAGPRAAVSRPLPPGARRRRGWRKPFAGAVRRARARAARGHAATGACPAAGDVAGVGAGGCFPPAGPRTRPGRAADRLRQPVLAPAINAAAIRVLTRHGIEVVVRGARAAAARSSTTWAASRRRSPPPAANIDAWTPRSRARASTRSSSPPRAAAPRSRTTASCCAPIAAYAERRRASRALAKDISEYLAALELSPERGRDRRLRSPIMRPARCSTARRSYAQPKELLCKIGLRRERCTGRTSVLRLGRHLQHPPAGDREEVARAQGRKYRKAQARRDRRRQYRLHDADRAGTAIPVVHTVELLDWATGGPDPRRSPGSEGSNAAGRRAVALATVTVARA